jgi:MFS transporter, FSR family, fosmidomycin resistance protein
MQRASAASNNERNVIVLAGVGHFATHFFELMFPTLAVVLAQDSGIPLEQVLGWSFAGYLLFGLGALPAGLLTDRLGGRAMLIAAMAGMGVAAIAASEVPPGLPLAVCLAVLGLFGSIYHPAGMSLISKTMAARGRALGINGIFGNVAIATTPFATALLCDRYGWQGAYAIAGFTMCAVAIACSWLPISEHTVAEPVLSPARATARPPRTAPIFPLLCLAAMLAGLSYRGNTLVQPAYFDARVPGLDYGVTTSLVYLFGIGGQYLGGSLADRGELRWLYLGFHLLSLPALLAMCFLSGMPLISAAAVFAFFSLGMQPIENSLFARFTPARWRATGYGVKFILTFGVGSLAVRLIAGMRAGSDLSTVFLYLAGVVAALVLVIAAMIALSAGVSVYNESTVRDAGTEPLSASRPPAADLG